MLGGKTFYHDDVVQGKELLSEDGMVLQLDLKGESDVLCR